MKWKWLAALAVLVPLGVGSWFAVRMAKAGAAAPTASSVPVTRVKRGTVTVTVAARGELQGGNSEMLTTPMTGGGDMIVTSLRSPGELVKPGEVVVQFDTTEQEYRLQEAEADVGEAEQQVLQARADSEAKDEETRYALVQARTEVKIAELEVRRNPLLAAIVAKQNDLALEAAYDRLRQLEQDLANRTATSAASIALQEAGRNKAKVQADTARTNIEKMTLRAKSEGYVNIQQNTNGNFMFWGMQLPTFQVGDNVRAGMAVAQIPDLKNWEVSARIGELDRGHLAPGQKVDITTIAAPGKIFKGKVKDMGGTSGPPWDRAFECKMTIENPSPQLRPGMTARIVVTTGVLPDALWVPSQAMFEHDGRTFVYLRTPAGFVPHDVKLVRRSESQVVLTGVSEGQHVAMANPDQEGTKQGASGGAMKAISR